MTDKKPPALPPWYGQVDCATEDRLLAEQAAREPDLPAEDRIFAEAQQHPWGEPGDNPRPVLRKRSVPSMPRIVGRAGEDITAGAAVVLDMTTGLVTIHHPDQEQQ